MICIICYVSDPEADVIIMCHHASLTHHYYILLLFLFLNVWIVQIFNLAYFNVSKSLKCHNPLLLPNVETCGQQNHCNINMKKNCKFFIILFIQLCSKV